MFKKPIFSILVLSLLFTCKNSTKSEPPIEDYFIFSDDTKQINDNDFSDNLISFLDDTSIITFKKDLDDIYSFNPGEIIISTEGEGLLKKIDRVQEDGDQTILYVSDATIEEAFKECHAEFTKNLAPLLQKGPYNLAEGVRIVPKRNNIFKPNTSITFNIDVVLYDFDGDSDTDNDQIRLSGELTLGGTINGVLDISNLNINELYLEWNLQQHLELNLEIPLGAIQGELDDEYTKTLGSIPFGTFTLGALPITISPVLELKAGLSYNLQSTLTTGIIEDFESTTVLEYAGNNQWDVDFDCTPGLDFVEPTIQTSVEAEAYIKPELLFKVYQSLSPYVFAKLFDKFEANVAETPWWKMYAGFTSGVGIKLKIWSATLFDFSTDLYEHEWLIAQANTSQDDLNVLVPTSNTVWNLDEDNVQIIWGTGEIGGNVKIELYKGDNFSRTIASSTSNDGEESWNVPSGLVVGDDYTIKITLIDDPSNYDYSPEFEIKSPLANMPPTCPRNPYPANNDDAISLYATLSWKCDDPDDDPLKFDVYFGTTNDPPRVSYNQNNFDYYPGPLSYNTDYYWKVVAKDNHGESMSCYDWHFTTGSETDNNFIWRYVNPSVYGYTYGENNDTLYIDYTYQMLKYEVTNAQYTAYLNQAYENGQISISPDSGFVRGFYSGDEKWFGTNYDFYQLRQENSRISFNYNGSYFHVQNGFEKHPVVNVTYFGAYAFANYYGATLPTEYEWERAARSHLGLVYPWGYSLESNRANYYFSGDPYDNGTTPIEYFPGSASPTGCADMAGNAAEWCSSFYNPSDDHRVTRGGSWKSDSDGIKTFVRGRASPAFPDEAIGFRCVKIPNRAPNQPINIFPGDGAIGVNRCPDLKWDCTDPDGDDLLFNIYFGKTATPPLVIENINRKVEGVCGLEANTKYYWKIVAKDEDNLTSESGVWNFTTGN